MSLKRRHWSSDEDVPNRRLDERRHVRALPLRRPAAHSSEKFTKYRSVSNTSSTDFDDSAADSSDTELGTALSDVESEIRDYTRGSSPPMDEGDEIDQSLRANSREPSSPGLPIPSWRVDVKGKNVDPREYSGTARLKRRRTEDSNSGSEGDDEGLMTTIVKTKKRARPTPLALKHSNFGPTRSILEITLGIDNLGEHNGDLEIIFSSDEDDEEARQISETLLTAPPSPSPSTSTVKAKRSSSPTFQHAVMKRQTSFEHVAYKRRCVAQGKTGRRSTALVCQAHRQAMPRQILRPYSDGSDSELEKMITSDVEREMVIVNNEVKRRKTSEDAPTRLPGQCSTAKLRRASPTSLLPLRERRKHLTAMRPRIKQGNMSHMPVVGQVMLAVLQDARADRIARRTAVANHYKRLEPKAHLLPSVILIGNNPQPQPPVTAAVVKRECVRRPAYKQLFNVWKKRHARDTRRITADRSIANNIVGPVRLPAPILSPTFAPLPTLSPEPPVLALPSPRARCTTVEDSVEDMVGNDESEESIRSASPALSDPPEYEPPVIPIRMNLPAHLRPRPPPRATPIEVPEYPWLSQFSGGEYHRLSPPPPPPFNAQTDAQTVVGPTFIDDEDEDEVAEGIELGASALSMSMIGAFPAFEQATSASASTSAQVASARDMGIHEEFQPRIIAPIPVRSYDIQAGRSSWEAALDLEEGDEDSVVGDLEDMVDEVEEEAQVEVRQSAGVLGSVGRLLGRVWRW